MSLSLNNSTIVPLLSGNTFSGQQYDNILDFAEINISIKCDTGYDLTYIYSQDKLSIDYQTTQSISAQIETQFYKIPVNDRYFKLKIDATDGNMSVLNVQTIYKSNITFNNSGSGPTSNVIITSPLTGSGAVSVGGSVLISNTSLDVTVSNFPATQDVNITNASVAVSGSIDVNNFPASQTINGSVDVNNFPATQDVNITNTSVAVSGSVDIGNFPASQTINGSVDANITNTSLDVAVSNFPATQDVNITNTSLAITNTNLDNLQFDVSNNLKVILQNMAVDVAVNNFPTTQDVNITNSFIDVGNFPATQNVNISDITANGTLNVSDADTHTYLNDAVTDLNKFTFDINSNLDVNLNAINSAFLQSGGLKTYVVNTSLAVTNSALSNMSFSLGNLNVKDTQNSYTTGALNVYDASSNTTLTNIYNCVNTRGSGIFIQGSITMGGYTSVIDLSTLPVKCLTIYGISSDATILTVLFSQDGSSFYASQYSYTLATANNFGFALTACPKYICLQTSEAVTTLQAYLDYS